MKNSDWRHPRWRQSFWSFLLHIRRKRVKFAAESKNTRIMNKQQLANRIWASANKLRSSIEANDYKDFILGLIFYKFLSDKEVRFLKEDMDIDEEAMWEITGDSRAS